MATDLHRPDRPGFGLPQMFGQSRERIMGMALTLGFDTTDGAVKVVP